LQVRQQSTIDRFRGNSGTPIWLAADLLTASKKPLNSAIFFFEGLGNIFQKLPFNDDDVGLNLALDSAIAEPFSDFHSCGVCRLNQSGGASCLNLAFEQRALAVGNCRNRR
jgi:hypothetical protein